MFFQISGELEPRMKDGELLQGRQEGLSGDCCCPEHLSNGNHHNRPGVGAALEPWMPSGTADPWKLDASLCGVESGPHMGAGQAAGHGQSVQATPGGETPTTFWF